MLYRYYLFENASTFQAVYSTLSDSEKMDVTDLGIVYSQDGEPLTGYHVNAAWRSNVEPEAFAPYRLPASDAPVWFDGVPSAEPEETQQIPETVSLRQLLFALVSLGHITGEEAMAAAKTGDFPSSFEPLLVGMPENEAFAVRLTWAAMYSADRTSPFWNILIASGAATEEDINNVFVLAAQA